MTNRAFTKNSPDKATELFAKLLETSDTAVKTRERLFLDLKEELELLARLQEQHLYPILRKHKETRDLVENAISDNANTATLLTELEHSPKNDDEFIKKVSNLRKIFQQHIRDDKSELLPAVLKVLSDDEAEAVAEQVEDDMAAVRTEAKREREKVESGQQITDGIEGLVKSGAEGAQRWALETQSGLDSALELSRRSTDQLLRLFSVPGRDVPALTSTASQALHSVTSSSAVLVRGTQNISREWFNLTQERIQKNLDAFAALSGCRSMQDLVAAQSSLVVTNLEQMIENSRRLAELSMGIGKDVAGTIAAQAEPAEPGRRAA